jgi:hypothetical protein
LIKHPKDFWTGVIFLVFGLSAVLIGRDYVMGTAGKMGPAYFPTVLGGLLAFLGLLIAAGGIQAKAPELRIEAFQWKPITTILLAVALFAALLPKMGLVVSLLLLIFISSVASHEFKIRDTAIASVVLLTLSWVVFVKGLELQFPLLPLFLAPR